MHGTKKVHEDKETVELVATELTGETSGHTLVEDELSLWKAVQQDFMECTGGLKPHVHQVEAVCRVISALKADSKLLRPVNYLLQVFSTMLPLKLNAKHATGSGKTLTVAALVRRLALGAADGIGGGIGGGGSGSGGGGGGRGAGEGPAGSRVCLVLLLNDRLQLDEQMAAAVEGFLRRSGGGGGGRVRVRRADTTERLAGLLRSVDGGDGGGGGGPAPFHGGPLPPAPAAAAAAAKEEAAEEEEGGGGSGGAPPPPPLVVLSTLQKFAGLGGRRFPGALARGRAVIVADEAHRSHGKGLTGQINAAFGGDPQRQPLGLAYVSLTATPGPTALRAFGRPRRVGNRAVYAPFHCYSMAQAVADGVALNVLRRYTCVRALVSWRRRGGGGGGGGDGSEGGGGGGGSRGGGAAAAGSVGVAEALAAHERVLRYKAKFIFRHYLNALSEYEQQQSKKERADTGGNNNKANFRPKAMVVCRSRAAVVALCRRLRALAERRRARRRQQAAAAAGGGGREEEGGEAGNTTYAPPWQGAHGFDLCTGLLAQEAAAAPRVYGAFSGTVAVDDGRPPAAAAAAAAGGTTPLTEGALNRALPLGEADVVVVCNKLETGYDEPRLGLMYVDRTLRGARAVQVLSRLNRTHPGKEHVEVVDFVNPADRIRSAFAEFWGPAIWAGSGEFSGRGTEAEIEYNLNLKLDGIVSRVLGLVEGLKDMTPQQAAEALLARCRAAGGEGAAAAAAAGAAGAEEEGAAADATELLGELGVYLEECARLSVHKVDLPFAWAAGLRRGLEARLGAGAGAAAAAAGGPSQEQIQEMADDMEVDVQGVKTTHSGEIKILKPHHVFPLQSLTEKQKKLKGNTTLSSMVEDMHKAGQGIEYIQKVAGALRSLGGGAAADGGGDGNVPEQSSSRGDPSLTLALLRRLDLVAMTLPYLDATKVAVVVRDLKSHPDMQIATLSKAMLKRWRRLLSETSPIFVKGVGDGSPGEVETREAIIKRLVRAFPSELQASSSDASQKQNTVKNIIEIAKQIEKHLFVLCKGMVSSEYKTKVRSLGFNLKDEKNTSLREKVLSGALSPSQLVKMSSDQLANDDVATLRNEVRKRKLEELEKWTASQDLLGNSNDYTCINCKSTKCFVNGTGTRGGWVSSQIEASIIVTCCDCNVRWEAG